jgi:hypothetical protein
MNGAVGYLNPLTRRLEGGATDGRRVTSLTDPLDGLVPFLGFDDIFTPEPEPKLMVPALGIAPGPPIGFFGQGYVGKTIVAMSCGVAVASGKPLWGIYTVKRGRWLHLDHEQGRRHTKSRIARLVAGAGIDRETLRGQFEVAVYPRLNLTTDGAEELYTRLFAGFDFVTIDALRGVTPGVDENASIIRDYLDILGRASDRIGATVGLIHHSGKTPIGGTRSRKEAGRGSSGIFDAHAAVFVMTAEKGEPIRVTHEKDRELGLLVTDFGLRIEDVPIDGNPKGGLRVAHLDKQQMAPATDPARGLERLVGRVVEVVARNPDCSGRFIRSECRGARMTDVDTAIDEAERGKLIRNLGSERRPKWRSGGGGT